MKKNVSINMDLHLVLSVDTLTDSVEVQECDARIIRVVASGIDQIKVIEHTISETENRYGILTLGAKSEVGGLIPIATEITIEIDGQRFTGPRPIITHRSARGRIDGLTQLYREFPEKLAVGAVLLASYEPKTAVLSLNSKI